MFNFSRKAARELRRLAVPIVITIIAFVISGRLSDVSKTALLVYKLSLVTLAWILWHMLRSETFWYLDFKTCLESDQPSRAIAAAIVLGATAIAVILGVTLGL